ncbi:cAMP-mediated signaling protein sok1 [Dimargaris verticillata]|uniref:cAMP-mediated signaling protein sok1 n=1 Tax=Dimargaris verticillata TaxID=2761393 RepID=A0A9W8B6J6_9FUNG|nr:cAMP-mediated signaling protein sok1 [Dimargaris verticillata]
MSGALHDGEGQGSLTNSDLAQLTSSPRSPYRGAASTGPSTPSPLASDLATDHRNPQSIPTTTTQGRSVSTAITSTNTPPTPTAVPMANGSSHPGESPAAHALHSPTTASAPSSHNQAIVTAMPFPPACSSGLANSPTALSAHHIRHQRMSSPSTLALSVNRPASASSLPSSPTGAAFGASAKTTSGLDTTPCAVKRLTNLTQRRSLVTRRGLLCMASRRGHQLVQALLAHRRGWAFTGRSSSRTVIQPSPSHSKRHQRPGSQAFTAASICVERFHGYRSQVVVFSSLPSPSLPSTRHAVNPPFSQRRRRRLRGAFCYMLLPRPFYMLTRRRGGAHRSTLGSTPAQRRLLPLASRPVQSQQSSFQAGPLTTISTHPTAASQFGDQKGPGLPPISVNQPRAVNIAAANSLFDPRPASAAIRTPNHLLTAAATMGPIRKRTYSALLVGSGEVVGLLPAKVARVHRSTKGPASAETNRSRAKHPIFSLSSAASPSQYRAASSYHQVHHSNPGAFSPTQKALSSTVSQHQHHASAPKPLPPVTRTPSLTHQPASRIDQFSSRSASRSENPAALALGSATKPTTASSLATPLCQAPSSVRTLRSHRSRIHHPKRPLGVMPASARPTSLHPPINRFTLRELSLKQIVNNISLRHDIVLEPNLEFQPINFGNIGLQKSKEADAYWQSVDRELRVLLQHQRASPRSVSTASASSTYNALDGGPSSRTELSLSIGTIIIMVGEIREIMIEMLTVHNQALRQDLTANLDLKLIRQQLEHGAFDVTAMVDYITSVLKKHCAPVRDRLVDRITRNVRRGDYTETLRQCFKLLELMSLDLANHQIRTMRHQLVATAVSFEWAYMSSLIRARTTSLVKTEQWWRDLLRSPTSVTDDSPSPRMTRTSTTNRLTTFLHGFVALVASSDDRWADRVPETFDLDAKRLFQFHHDWQRIAAMAVVLLIYRQALTSFLRGPAKALDANRVTAHMHEVKAEAWRALNTYVDTLLAQPGQHSLIPSAAGRGGRPVSAASLARTSLAAGATTSLTVNAAPVALDLVVDQLLTKASEFHGQAISSAQRTMFRSLLAKALTPGSPLNCLMQTRVTAALCKSLHHAFFTKGFPTGKDKLPLSSKLSTLELSSLPETDQRRAHTARSVSTSTLMAHAQSDRASTGGEESGSQSHSTTATTANLPTEFTDQLRQHSLDALADELLSLTQNMHKVTNYHWKVYQPLYTALWEAIAARRPFVPALTL